MQDIGIATSRVAEVSRSDGSPRIYLTFRGTRDAPHVVDKDTRLRITMPVDRALELWQELGRLLPEAAAG